MMTGIVEPITPLDLINSPKMQNFSDGWMPCEQNAFGPYLLRSVPDCCLEALKC
jgi:hypothetical protein